MLFGLHVCLLLVVEADLLISGVQTLACYGPGFLGLTLGLNDLMK